MSDEAKLLQMATSLDTDNDFTALLSANGAATEYLVEADGASLPPGRPLRTRPVVCPSDISAGDHILYLICDGDQYRPMYRSALVGCVEKGEVSFIEYSHGGVQRENRPFCRFKSLHKVDYTVECREDEVAIKRARGRLGERHYHGLFNNSHHFVSWAKTRTEYSLADLVLGVEGQ